MCNFGFYFGAWVEGGEGERIVDSLFLTTQCSTVGHVFSDSLSLEQRSPTFLAPGTGLMEDSFSTDGGGGMV